MSQTWTERLEDAYAEYAELSVREERLLEQIASVATLGPGPGADTKWGRLTRALAAIEKKRHLVDVAIRGPRRRPDLGLEHQALKERVDDRIDAIIKTSAGALRARPGNTRLVTA